MALRPILFLTLSLLHLLLLLQQPSPALSVSLPHAVRHFTATALPGRYRLDGLNLTAVGFRPPMACPRALRLSSNYFARPTSTTPPSQVLFYPYPEIEVDDARCGPADRTLSIVGSEDIKVRLPDVLSEQLEFLVGLFPEDAACGKYRVPGNTTVAFLFGDDDDITLPARKDPRFKLPARTRIVLLFKDGELACAFSDRTNPTKFPSRDDDDDDDDDDKDEKDDKDNRDDDDDDDASESPRITIEATILPDDPACFPADALVRVEHRGPVRMDQLRVGDRVQVGPDAYSEIILFSHRDPDFRGTFIQLDTEPAGAAPLRLSPGHYVYVAPGRLARAADLRPGDVLQHVSGAPCVVAAVSVARAAGLYNPHTAHGDIVVHDLRASTFTDAAHPALARALLKPVGWLVRAGAVTERAAGQWFKYGVRRALYGGPSASCPRASS